MNQILSTDMPMDDRKNNKFKKNKIKNNKPVDIQKVLKVFAIVLLVFGVFMIGTGSYSIYKNQNQEEKNTTKPTITIENKTDTTLLLKVMHNRNIAEVRYHWNNEDETLITGNQRKYIEQVIDIPAGTNTLYVVATDENGQEISYEKEYKTNSNINFEVVGNKIKITYQSDKEISYMTYRWDEQDEVKVDINDTSIEKEIDAIKGLHTLTVVVVDEDNNTDTKQQKINGVSKPELVVDVDESREHFVISASDETGIEKFEIRIDQDDGQKYQITVEGNKEYKCTLPMSLHTGDNFIEVKVYNSNGVTEERNVRFKKQ